MEEHIVSKETLALLESEFESVLSETLEKVNITQQMGWTTQILTARIENNQKMLDENQEDIKILEKKAAEMYRKLYSINEVKYHALPTLEIATTGDAFFYKERYHLPAPGKVVRPQINLSSMYFAVKQRLLSGKKILNLILLIKF